MIVNYGDACAAFLEPGDHVVINGLVATVSEKDEHDGGKVTLTFQAVVIGDERTDGFPAKRQTFSETVAHEHLYPFLFHVDETDLVYSEEAR